MNGISLRIAGIATVATLGACLFAATGVANAAKPGKNGTIYACFKAKGKNKGALRVVGGKRGCTRMRGWRLLSWSAKGSTGQSGATGGSQLGPQGEPGPEGKQGAAGQVEKSLIETVQSQTAQINALSAEVTDLTSEVLSLEGDLSNLEGTVGGLSGDLGDLEGVVGQTCDQLSVLTEQTDEVLASLLGSTVAVLGNLLDVPSPPEPLGPFECS